VNFTEVIKLPVLSISLSTNLPIPNELLLLTIRLLLPEGLTLNLTNNIDVAGDSELLTSFHFSVHNITVGAHINSSSM